MFVLESVVWILVVLVVCLLAGFAAGRIAKRKRRAKSKQPDPSPLQPQPSENPYKISYIPSDMEWSGSTAEVLPIKTLTYKQYDCLEDARYGFKIVGLTPTERKKEQAHKTRAHGLKTVASLVRLGFLKPDGGGGHAITDLGLNALEVCKVRY